MYVLLFRWNFSCNNATSIPRKGCLFEAAFFRTGIPREIRLFLKSITGCLLRRDNQTFAFLSEKKFRKMRFFSRENLEETKKYVHLHPLRRNDGIVGKTKATEEKVLLKKVSQRFGGLKNLLHLCSPVRKNSEPV